MSTAPLQKICGLCGEDCSGRPRIKDPQGRYYCKTCYEEVLERRKGGPSPVVPQAPREPEGQLSGALLAELADEVVPPPMQGVPCPGCGNLMTPGAVICTACGYDTRSGHRVDVTQVTKPEAEKPVQPLLWPVYLFVRPKLFFTNCVAGSPALLIAILAWIYGMAGATDRMETRQALAEMSGRPFALPDAWTPQWAIIVVGGVVGGAAYAFIGGWWYRVRLRWSGATDPDSIMARRVYIFASLIYAIPVLIRKLIETAAFSTPGQALNSDLNVMDLAVLACVFWSCWNSYVGVRTVFDTSRGRAMLWFLILPAMLYTVAIGVVMALVVFGSLFASADVRNPQRFRSDQIEFMYPGNWWIDTASPDYDPNGYLFVEPFQDATFHLMLYEPEASAEEELEASLDGFRVMMANAVESDRFTAWAGFSGQGQSLSGRFDGTELEVMIFVAQLEDGRFLEVQETCAAKDRGAVEPGFELIRSTLRIRSLGRHADGNGQGQS